MSDATDGSGPIPRRVPRAGDGGAPVSGALAIVLAVVAIVAGFLILKSISDGDSSIGSPAGAVPAVDETTTTTIDPTGAAATLPPTTTVPPLVTTGATVMVANANGIRGSAGAMSTALEIVGFAMASPGDANLSDLAQTIVYYNAAVPASQAVADSVARSLGGASVLPLPEGTPPVASGTTNGADVLLMLGLDKANKTLAELNPAAAAAPIVTNPTIGITTTTVV